MPFIKNHFQDRFEWIEPEPKKHGGKRKGAGRPKVDVRKKPVSVALSPAEIVRLDFIAEKMNCNRSKALVALINGYYNSNKKSLL